MSSRGRGNRGKTQRRGHRHVADESEIIARNAAIRVPERDLEDSDEGKNEDGVEKQKVDPVSNDEEDDSEEDEDNQAKSFTYIETNNPNYGKSSKVSTGLSRREREQLKNQQYDRVLDKLMAEGKTTQAKADLVRLAEVRARREESAANKKATEQLKAKAAAPSVRHGT